MYPWLNRQGDFVDMSLPSPELRPSDSLRLHDGRPSGAPHSADARHLRQSIGCFAGPDREISGRAARRFAGPGGPEHSGAHARAFAAPILTAGSLTLGWGTPHEASTKKEKAVRFL